MGRNERGFSVVELLLALGVIVALALSGWSVYKNQSKQDDSSKKSITSSESTAKSTSKPAQDELVIKEWNVKLVSKDLPKKHTHKLIVVDSQQRVKLSDADNDKYEAENCPDYINNAYQYIIRYRPGQTVTDYDDDDFRESYITIEEAARKSPDTFKVINGYGYELHRGNGMPCNESIGYTGYDLVQAYESAFGNLQAIKE